MLLLYSIAYLFAVGVGSGHSNFRLAWGLRSELVWGSGIGHAGHAISAILLLLLQAVATSINRFCETMTLLRILRGKFSHLSICRPCRLLLSLPHDENVAEFPQPLGWDAFAFSTYATVSGAVLVHRAASRPRNAPDRAKNPVDRRNRASPLARKP